MRNFILIGKGIVIFLVMLAFVDLVWLGYVYVSCTRAMENTLSSVALVVAEDNCLDSSGGENSKLYSIKSLMVENAPMWLTYNSDGFAAPGNSQNGWNSAKPTSLRDGKTKLKAAVSNVSTDAITLTDMNNTKNTNLYSYVDAPQRGTPINVKLTAYINVHLLSLIPQWGNISIPISRETTVIGMRFYKGKE